MYLEYPSSANIEYFLSTECSVEIYHVFTSVPGKSFLVETKLTEYVSHIINQFAP